MTYELQYQQLETNQKVLIEAGSNRNKNVLSNLS